MRSNSKYVLWGFIFVIGSMFLLPETEWYEGMGFWFLVIGILFIQHAIYLGKENTNDKT